ncbi:PREDICTED: endochitinase CHI-like isoform X3 [Camelina sativa]|uniref:Endochitinase CHI-like isoform X1 n=2 Tax=Camelina sativa TaxID=90675 RepID=A0ABM1Q6I1_CAMSA|nr:PREDICTED: endochitinase CHI-like isoform X1 [Camelina sativa]XP_019082370.1 PREDICTED: endochitinase CHI-like isoform X2 [Camelina sativa]XP_019082371.1 PREDICTED: endochitinase CHI-like isoform X3 [Camelina sativa]
MANNAKSTTRKDTYALFLPSLLVLTLTVSKPVTSQNCGCASDFCCSQWGYCGQTDDYCGYGCREGPCQGGGDASGEVKSGGGGDAVSLEGTVTPEFFNSIINQARSDCAGKGFYSHDAFIAAANSYQSFGASISKREIAAFFAHVTHETEFMCYIEEIDGPANAEKYCDKDKTNFPCAEGKGYYGRGPIQLTGNLNYGLCGRELNENLLASPEKVAQDPVLAFKTAFWFWTTNVRQNFNQGFGATIRAVNGIECSGGNSATVAKRIEYYRDYCGKLGVEPGENLSC